MTDFQPQSFPNERAKQYLGMSLAVPPKGAGERERLAQTFVF